MKSYIVVGLGRFGSQISRQLCALGAEVLAIDLNAELVQQIAAEVTTAAVADAQDKEVLRALGAADCDCAIVAIGDNLGASVLATMNLKELGVPYVVCKAYDEIHRRVLEKLGADKVLIPEKEVANKLANSLTRPNVLEYIELSQDYGIVEVPVPEMWSGKTIRALNIRAKLGVNIIAIQREGRINVSPSADYLIRSGDVAVLLGAYDALAAVERM